VVNNVASDGSFLSLETSVGGDKFSSSHITELIHGHGVGVITEIVSVNFVHVGLKDVVSGEELLSIVRLFVGLHELDKEVFILFIGEEVGRDASKGN